MRTRIWLSGCLAITAAALATVTAGAAAADPVTTDLAMELGGLPGPTPVGFSSEFAFTIHAVGGTAHEPAAVKFLLPPQLRFSSVSVDSPTPLKTCVTAGDTTTCQLADVTATPATGPSVYLTFTVAKGAVLNDRYEVIATVVGSLPDPDTSNDTTYGTVRIEPSSKLIASVSPTTLVRGRTNWVTVTVRNDGPDPASGVQFAYLYLVGSGFTMDPDANLRWHAAGQLLPGHSVSTAFPVKVSSSAGHGFIYVGPIADSNLNPHCTAQQCAYPFALTARDATPTLAATGQSSTGPLAWGVALLLSGSLITVAARRRTETEARNLPLGG